MYHYKCVILLAKTQQTKLVIRCSHLAKNTQNSEHKQEVSLVHYLHLNCCVARVCCKLARHWMTAAP